VRTLLYAAQLGCLTVALALPISRSIAAGQTQSPDPPLSQISLPESKLPTRGSLMAAATRFVTALIEKDTGALLQQFSNSGVVFDVDEDPIPREKIGLLMAQKAHLYCLLLDTACLRNNPIFKSQWAPRDSLLGGKSYRLEAGTPQEINHRLAMHVRLFVQANPDRAGRGEEFCNLDYILEEGSWKVSGVQIY